MLTVNRVEKPGLVIIQQRFAPRKHKAREGYGGRHVKATFISDLVVLVGTAMVLAGHQNHSPPPAA